MPDMGRPVDVEPRSVSHRGAAVHRRAAVLTTVHYLHRCYIHVRDYVSVHRHVLADHEPAGRRGIEKNQRLRRLGIGEVNWRWVDCGLGKYGRVEREREGTGVFFGGRLF